MSEHPHIVVIGAGIAGLSAAFYLQSEGLQVTIFEESHRPGGVIRTEREDGFLVEFGPNSIQPEAAATSLLGALKLGDEIVEARPVQRNRFIVRDGRLIPVPLGPAAFLKSRLFSLAAKVRLLREPFIGPGERDETVADFVRRRVGREFLDYAINPFVAGVFAGDPERLLMRFAFPKMKEVEDKHGSLLRGMLAARKEASRSGRRRRLISFREGMQTLPLRLARTLGSGLHTGSAVSALRRASDGWRMAVAGREGDVGPFDAVVCAIPAHRLRALAFNGVQRLPEINYPRLTVVALGYERAQVAHALDGFGLLVPNVENQYRVLGALFTSSIFPDRAPTDTVLLTTFLGGMRHPHAEYLTGDLAAHVAHEDVARLLDISAPPIHQKVISWRHAIPQYDRSYPDALRAIETLERNEPGLFLTGNYRGGISVVDTIASAHSMTQRVLKYLQKPA